MKESCVKKFNLLVLYRKGTVWELEEFSWTGTSLVFLQPFNQPVCQSMHSLVEL